MLVPKQQWFKQIMNALERRFRDGSVVIGDNLASLLHTVPFVFLTKHMIEEEISKCLRTILDGLEFDANRNFPGDFATYIGRWNAETFKGEFREDMEKTCVKGSFTRLFKLDKELQLIMYGLQLLTSPSMLPVATDFEGMLVENFNKYAHESDIASIKKTLETGKGVKNDANLSSFSRGCLQLMEYIAKAKPLLKGSEAETLFEETPPGSDEVKIGDPGLDRTARSDPVTPNPSLATATSVPATTISGPASIATEDPPTTRRGTRYGILASASQSSTNDNGAGPSSGSGASIDRDFIPGASASISLSAL